MGRRLIGLFAATLVVVGGLGLVLKGSPLRPVSGTWLAVSDMGTPRAGATASLLSGGRVLVAGGQGPAGVAASVEVFTPEGLFSSAAPMSVARSGHTATVLADGRVLVAGGTGVDGAPIASAEIYEAATDAWAEVPAGMTEPRAGHSATLLTDGRVLIVGGAGAEAVSTTMELFDPATGTFVAGGAMPLARRDHAAAALSDGRVLIAGGSDGAQALASTDIFDPATGALTAGPDLATPRTGASATTLLNGTVLVAGGASDGGVLASADLFDPATNSFAVVDSALGAARQNHLAILLPHNNQVLIVGGTAAGSAVPGAEIFTPWQGTSGTFCSTAICASGYVGPVMPGAARAGAAGSALSFPASKDNRFAATDGLALVAGGDGLRSAEVYGFATVHTDKDDYAPGETVTITGRGWVPGEWIAIVLKESPTLDEHPLEIVQADENGNFASTEFKPDEHDLNVKFYLTAFGTESQAQTWFTDALPTRIQTSSMGPSQGSCGSMINVSATLEYKISKSNNWGGLAGKTVSFALGGSSGSGTTDANGVASAQLRVPAGATSLVASFAADTTYNDTTSSIAFTVSGSCTAATVTTINAPSMTYGANASVTVTVSSGSGTPTGNVSLSVDGGAPVAKSLTSGTAVFTSADIPTLASPGAGDHTLAASYAAQGSFGASSNTGSLHVEKANSTTTVTCPTNVTYTGSVLTPCTASVTGPGGLSQSLAVSYADNVNAGTATASASFAGDANHEGSSASEEFTIDKAASATVVTCGTEPFTYTGSALEPCTASVTGAGGLSQSLTVSYASNVNAGTATASASFAGDENHTESSDTTTFTIDKAASTTVVTCPANVTFTGSALEPCSAEVTGAGGLSQALTVDYANNVNAGTASASASFAGDENHTESSDTTTFTIDKAASATVVTCGTGPFTYTGSALEPCTASVTGAGGLNQSLTVSYASNVNAGTATASASFAGDENHTESSDATTFTIDKAASTTVVTCPANVTFTGNALTPCTASVTGPGGLSQSLAVSYADNTNAGTASASATFGGDANHEGSSGSGSFAIDKAPSAVTVSCPTSVTYTGSPLTPCTAKATGVGGLDQSLTVTYANNIVGTATASATYAGDANHLGNGDSKTFTILYSTGLCLGSPGHTILQPINVDGTSVFKQKSTVPAKFRVCDANGKSVGTPGVVSGFFLGQVVNGTVADIDEAVDSTTPDTNFRWSATDQQWIFNISTRNLNANATYAYRVTLNDGSTIQFQFGLK